MMDQIEQKIVRVDRLFPLIPYLLFKRPSYSFGCRVIVCWFLDVQYMILPHLSQLPNSVLFVPSQMAHLVPAPMRTLRENVLSILHNSSPQLPIYPDPNLLKSSPNLTYHHIQGGYTEDIDPLPNHFSLSLEVGATILNFLHTVTHLQTSLPASNKYVLRHEHVSKDRVELAQCHRKEYFGYNIYKHEGVYVFLVGKITSYAGLANCVREWNFSRLQLAEEMYRMEVGKIPSILDQLLSITSKFATDEEYDCNNQREGLTERLRKFQGRIPSGKELGPDFIYSVFTVAYGQMSQQILWGAFGDIFQELLRLLHKSYSFSATVTEGINQIVLNVLTSYDSPRKIPQIDASFSLMAQFMRDKVYEQLKQKNVHAAQEIFKSSLQLYNRYSEQEKGGLISLSPKKIVTKYTPIYSFNGYSIHDQNHTLFMETKKGYLRFLAAIDEHRGRYGQITPCSKMSDYLREDILLANSAQGSTTPKEQELLRALLAIKYYLPIDEILGLLQGGLLEILTQPHNVRYLIELGLQVARKNISSIYNAYIFKNTIREHLLISIMKSVIFLGKEKPMELSSAEVSTPLLLELLESKELNVEKYRALVAPLIPLIFQERAVMLIAPILHCCESTLLESHHEQLVNGLMGDLAYEAIYYSHEKSPMKLTNQPYSQYNLKAKKLKELLRECGFRSMGHEIKKDLLPLIRKHNSAHMDISFQHVFEGISVEPSLVCHFMRVLEESAHGDSIRRLVQYFAMNGQFYRIMQQPMSKVMLSQPLTRFDFSPGSQDKIFGDVESESGIFEQLLQYNPQIKIAGQSVRVRCGGRSGRGEFQFGEVVRELLGEVGLEETYESIRIGENIRDRVEDNEELKQRVVSNRSGVMEYLKLDRILKSHLKYAFTTIF